MAEQYSIPTPTPDTWEDIRTVIEDEIPANLEQAMCGGWNTNRSIGTEPGTGLISRVEGVPGHKGLLDTVNLSGMAKREETGGALNNGFAYPDDASGHVTACVFTDEPTVTKNVWVDPADPSTPGSVQEVQVPNISPKPADPPCRWQRDGAELQGPHSPERCAEFCAAINAYTYTDCREFLDVWEDGDGNWVGNFPKGEEPEGEESGYRIVGERCARQDEKYLCTDAWVTPEEEDEQDAPNCKPCMGAECRCPGPGCTYADDEAAKPYLSFFRRYTAVTHRDALSEVPGDQLTDVTIPVACYGTYNEFDPKYFTVFPEDRKCVVYFPYSKRDGNEWAVSDKGLRTSQTGKGSLEPEFPADDMLPPDRSPEFDAGRDLWHQNLGGGLSFLSETVFARDYARDLALTFFHTDIGQMLATRQDASGKRITALSRLRAPEDTVSNERQDAHTIETWWNKFLTDMGRLISPPVMRLRIPSALAAMLEALPPETLGVVTGSKGSATVTAGQALKNIKGWESIDFQLDATDDMLGFVTVMLNQTFTLRMEQVPVVYPLGSPESYRALSQQWEDYMQQRRSITSTGTEPGDGGEFPQEEIEALQERLEDYANRAEEYRTLRNELPRYVSRLLSRQYALTLGMQNWSNENLRRYKRFVEERSARLHMATEVRDLQGLYASFDDDVNQPWCMLSHFTTPIYSDLDPWLPDRPRLDGGIPSCSPSQSALPMLCIPQNDRELVLDLTNFASSLDGFTVPVPMPVGVQLRLPTPPDPQDTPPKAEALQLPSLPAVPAFDETALGELPEVLVRGIPSLVPAPSTVDLDTVRASLENARDVLEGMKQAYSAFWENAEPQEHTYNLWCDDPGVEPCWYVESELMQIMTRLTSMPMVYVREHRALELPGFATCDPRDRACQELHPERRLQTDGWQIIGPADAADDDRQTLDTLRTRARETTISPEGALRKEDGRVLPYTVPAGDLYPVYTVPPASTLSVPSPNP